MGWCGKNVAALNLWFQMFFWTVFFACFAAFLGLVFITLEEPPPKKNELLIYLAGYSLLMGVLSCFFRRYWFLASDLKRLLQTRGGTEFHIRQRWWRPKMKARVGELWVLAYFENLIFDFWPHKETDRGDFRHWGDLEKSHVNFFRLGDFSKLPQGERRVTKDWNSDSVSSQTNGRTLDNALRVATDVLRDPDLTLTVEVREKWLRIGVTGGIWLGTVFGQRIHQALGFSERLIQELAPCYTPLGPNEWTIDSEDKAFIVKPVDKARTISGSDGGPNHKMGVLSTSWQLLS